MQSTRVNVLEGLHWTKELNYNTSIQQRISFSMCNCISVYKFYWNKWNGKKKNQLSVIQYQYHEVVSRINHLFIVWEMCGRNDLFDVLWWHCFFGVCCSRYYQVCCINFQRGDETKNTNSLLIVWSVVWSRATLIIGL